MWAIMDVKEKLPVAGFSSELPAASAYDYLMNHADEAGRIIYDGRLYSVYDLSIIRFPLWMDSKVRKVVE